MIADNFSKAPTASSAYPLPVPDFLAAEKQAVATAAYDLRSRIERRLSGHIFGEPLPAVHSDLKEMAVLLYSVSLLLEKMR